jgi:hypothetical protein
MKIAFPRHCHNLGTIIAINTHAINASFLLYDHALFSLASKFSCFVLFSVYGEFQKQSPQDFEEYVQDYDEGSWSQSGIRTQNRHPLSLSIASTPYSPFQ